MDTAYSTFFRFFGLRENAFNVNPDPNYLYLNQRTQSVLQDLLGAIQARKGLMVVTGDVGTGKTTLLNSLIQNLSRHRTPTAFIFNPYLQVSELFDLMLASFAIPRGYGSGASSLGRLTQWLFERYRAGANAVLIIDEAQGLPPHVLEEIRMLLNQETPHEKLLQIVLCGQPELEDKLKRPEFRLIRQRISLRCRLTTLTREEAHAYIDKRLRTAGAANSAILSPAAVDAVHLYSRGIPRLMNILCEHALIRAYLEQVRPVSPLMIENVARQLQLDEVKPLAAPAPISFQVPESAASTSTAIEDASAAPVLTAVHPAAPPPTPDTFALIESDLALQASSRREPGPSPIAFSPAASPRPRVIGFPHGSPKPFPRPVAAIRNLSVLPASQRLIRQWKNIRPHILPHVLPQAALEQIRNKTTVAFSGFLKAAPRGLRSLAAARRHPSTIFSLHFQRPAPDLCLALGKIAGLRAAMAPPSHVSRKAAAPRPPLALSLNCGQE